MIGLLLAAGLTVVSTAAVSSTSPSWACAYTAERMPRALTVLGDDTVWAEETRTARRRLGLADAVLTRAANLALARSLGATRLVVVRCTDSGQSTTLEAQAFDTNSPTASEVVRLTRPLADIATSIDQLARRLSLPGESANTPRTGSLRPPSPRALARAGAALLLGTAGERATGLAAALNDDPTSVDLRLSAVGSLIASRDFDGAARLAGVPSPPDTPAPLARALRFQEGAALLESGRYAEARATFEALRRDRETAGALNNLGVSMFRLRESAASEIFERASFIEDHRQSDIAFNRSLSLLFDGRAQEALPFLDTALKAAPDDARTRLLRSWALRLLNREADRAEEWERLMRIAPSFSALGNPDVARRLERIFLFERNAMN